MKIAAIDTQSKEDLSRLLDTGILKAMLDIFNDYTLKGISSNQQVRSEDNILQNEIGQVMIAVIQSKMSQFEFTLKLYAFRTLAVICRRN